MSSLARRVTPAMLSRSNSACPEGADHLACSKARRTGTCEHRRSIRRGVFEDLIWGALKDRLMAPEQVRTFIEEFHREVNLRHHDEEIARSTLEVELTGINRYQKKA
jgi:hypothetical protein